MIAENASPADSIRPGADPDAGGLDPVPRHDGAGPAPNAPDTGAGASSTPFQGFGSFNRFD
ncbi:hypothetical protein [Arenibaculum pallidiluteum]|uniref:hypothetical protein n=1 Tax=Arenibaculum pallidiluteum TaxID=2812559 RepID=UPI001A975D97|nr:hypothetical protein [Arenibaculum pallidiluteum]